MFCTKDIEDWLEEDCFKTRSNHNNQSLQIQEK